MLLPLSDSAVDFISEYYQIGDDVLAKYPEAVDELIERNFLERRGYQTINSYLDKGIPFLSRLWNEYAPGAWSDEIVEPVGWGLWGVVYELADGSMLKLTTDPAEVWCVEFIKRKGLQSIHLPDIYEFGQFSSLSGGKPMFYYIREPLDDAPAETYAEQLIPVTKLFVKMGIDAPDAHLRNWGVRPDDPFTLVLRDVACIGKPTIWQKLRDFFHSL